MERRPEHHIEQDGAIRQQNGRVFYQRNLLNTLRERDVARVGAERASDKAPPFRTATDSKNVIGKFTRPLIIVEQTRAFIRAPR